jgi:hypothetical protein
MDDDDFWRGQAARNRLTRTKMPAQDTRAG